MIITKRLKALIKDMFHVHKYKTLLVYPPHNRTCNQKQCEKSNDYGFLIQCECGYTKLTKLPPSITEVYHVKP